MKRRAGGEGLGEGVPLYFKVKKFPSQRGGVREGGPYALCGAMHSIRSFSESFT